MSFSVSFLFDWYIGPVFLSRPVFHPDRYLCLLLETSCKYLLKIRKKPMLSGQNNMVRSVSGIFCTSSRCTGDILHFQVLGQHFVVLNSLHSARDLLEKRSSIYSDRPRFVLLSEMYVGFRWVKLGMLNSNRTGWVGKARRPICDSTCNEFCSVRTDCVVVDQGFGNIVAS